MGLIIDDEPTVRRLIGDVLRRSGWEVHEAAGGVEGLSLLASAGAPGYDLVLCDVRMPRLDGMRLYVEVAARWPELLPRLVLCSGSFGDPEVTRFLRRTGVATLAKPFGVRDLLRLADAALG